MVDWCDINNGVELSVYNWMRLLSEILYDCLVISELTIKFFGRVLILAFPGMEVGMCLFDGNSIPDFRLPTKKFWAVKFSILGDLVPVAAIPLPKTPICEIWGELFSKHDIKIDGSGSFLYFKDPLDGEWRKGTDCTPAQEFGVLEHGVPLVYNIAKFYYIARIIVSLGLVHSASKIFGRIYGLYRTATLRNNVSEVLDTVEDTEDAIQLIDGEIEELGFKVDQLKTMLGVKLILR